MHGPFCMAMVTLMNTVCIMLIVYRYWSVEERERRKDMIHGYGLHGLSVSG